MVPNRHRFLKFVLSSLVDSIPCFGCSEMIKQLSDSGLTGGGTSDGPQPSSDKQLPVAVKKQALRDLPTENNVTATRSTGNSALPKEKGFVAQPDKVSGTKRPSSEVNPPLSQASSAVNANGNLVYVRRKTEGEVGKVSGSTSVTTSSNFDHQLSVKAPVSNEKVQPRSNASKPQVEACNGTRSSEPPASSPAMLTNSQNKSPLPQKSGNIMPSGEDKSLLPHPVAKPGDTVSSAENKSPLTHPPAKSGNLMASVEDKSPLPHPVAKSSNIMSSSETKFLVPHPLVKSGNLMPSMEEKSLLPYHVKKSSNGVSSTENKSPLPHPLGKSGSTVSSTENKSPLPQPVGKSSGTMLSTENKSLVPHPLGKSGNNVPSTENKSPILHPVGISSNTMSSTENKSSLLHSLGKAGNTMPSTENKSQVPHSFGNSGNIMPSADGRSPLTHAPGKSGSITSSMENNHVRPASITAKLDFAKESYTMYLQRHAQPQVTLRGLDRSGHEEYLQMLRALSSVELSRLAFELETRSIQLSLEEAKEMARLEMLNVLGKSAKISKTPIAQPSRLEK